MRKNGCGVVTPFGVAGYEMVHNNRWLRPGEALMRSLPGGDDMQIGIVRQSERSDAVTMQVARVLDAARRCAGVFTRHMSLPKE
jgi:hypothetical protein